VIQYESDFGIKSVRSERYASTPNLKHEPILETEEEGIRVYFMNDDVAMSHLADDFGNDPMKIDAVFHSANTGLGGFSYALAQQLKEKLHLHATLVMIPLIDRTSSVSICQQAKGIMTEILEECKRNNWHRIRLTNFTYLKSSQFETFLGIGQVLTEQEDQHALTIYLDIDPDFVKGKYGDELNFLGPCKS
jgi:hypothetical protein